MYLYDLNLIEVEETGEALDLLFTADEEIKRYIGKGYADRETATEWD
jgi:hypothetical protein